jgi:hypothetical protein
MNPRILETQPDYRMYLMATGRQRERYHAACFISTRNIPARWDVVVQVCRARVRCFSKWKSCAGEGRPGRVATDTARPAFGKWQGRNGLFGHESPL